MANYNERIAATKEEIEQYENQMKQLIQKQKAQARKDRTKRLIERGAILESLIDSAETFTNEQIKSFLEKTARTEYARKILNGMKPQDSEPAAQESAESTQDNATATAQTVGYSIGQGA